MKISEHFDESEFRCKCCGKLPPQFRDSEGELTVCYQTLFDQLEDIRSAWGRPLRIKSGYRCSQHNSVVGGSPLSVHMFGLAVDLGFSSDNEVAKFIEVARSVAPYMRRGWKMYVGKKFCHLDVADCIYPRPSENFVGGVEW